MSVVLRSLPESSTGRPYRTGGVARRLTKTQRHRRNLRRRVFTRDGYRCVECGRKSPPGGLTLDHIIPRSKGGPGTADNLQTMCHPCNFAKADKLPEWAERKSGERWSLRGWHPEPLDRVARAA